MFWGISCDSGKRYSQNVNASYHISMASLETRDSSYAKKAVSLMVEHKNNEFLLCTLQYEHCMQVNLDLLFKKGEDVTFFLNGQGTVHLTGYLIEDDDDDSIAPPPSDDGVQIMEDFEDSSIAFGEDNPKSRKHLKRSSRPTGNSEILKDDDDDDDDDSDYVPTKVLEDDSDVDDSDTNTVPTKDNSKKKNERDKPEVNGRKADIDESDDEEEDDEDVDEEEEDDDDDEEEEEDDDDDEEDEHQEEKVSLTNQKRKVQTTIGNDPKRIKKDSSMDPQASKNVPKKPTVHKPNVKQSIPTISVEDEEDEEEEESDDDDSDDEDSNEADEEEDMESSIGRTPMPKRQDSVKTPKEDMESSIGRTPMPPKRQESVNKPSNVTMKLDFVPSPSVTKNLTEKAKDPSVNKKKKKDNSIKTLEQSFSKKLEGGVEIEDLRIGNGPMAKKPRMAHIYYVGQLPNNSVFDSCKSGSKPFVFRLGRGEVIKGLDVGMEGMKVGGKRKIKIPPNMGYGKKPTGSIPSNSTLYFTIELKAIT